MSTIKHNKKRNTGLIYQFLIRSISEGIVSKNKRLKEVALAIIKKHFHKDSELFREYKLFNSLVETSVDSNNVAETIIEVARKSSRQYDKDKLDKEKSLLIRSINHLINDNSFYNKRFNQYKIYATVQTLLNEWRSDRYSDIVKIAEYEDTLKNWLLKDKTNNIVELKLSDDVDPLVEKLMIEKFNEKFGNHINDEQKEIIKNYIFYENDIDKLREYLSDIKSKTLNEMVSYIKDNNDQYMAEKLKTAKSLIEDISLENIDDKVIEKFLDICKLKNELKEV